MKPIQISAKTLGAFALETHCARCMWIRLHHKRLPWQVFPGIFSSIDRWSSRLTHAVFGTGQNPSWLGEFGEVVELLNVPHWSRFKTRDSATNITLTGVPDEIVRFADDTLGILDYKTARYTEGQDALLPLYEVQLNAYRYIAERLGYGQVSTLGLIYFEPTTDAVDGMSHQTTAAGANMPFATRSIEMPRTSDEKIAKLLADVRHIHDAVAPPCCRPGCRDCESLARITSFLAGAHPPTASHSLRPRGVDRSRLPA